MPSAARSTSPNTSPEYASLDELKEHYRRGGLGDVKVKRLLIAVLNETLEPIRERRHYYEARIGEVYDILRRGSETARAAAAETLADVRRAMKIDYFDDEAHRRTGPAVHRRLRTLIHPPRRPRKSAPTASTPPSCG